MGGGGEMSGMDNMPSIYGLFFGEGKGDDGKGCTAVRVVSYH